MKNPGPNTRLFIVFTLVLAFTTIAIVFNTHPRALPYADTMRESARLAQQWFDFIEEVKGEREIQSDVHSNVPNAFMIGDDWSDITTTLGSLEAKETATNPDFAALMVRFLHEGGMQKGDTVGVLLSGSFPSLSVAVLAALQTMDLKAVVMSSLGASTYGANQPGATWLDMEGWLRERGGLKYSSLLVSMGADQDHGNGLTEEGKSVLRLAADRNGRELYMPASLEESILLKTEILQEKHICMLINVGGNMAALGSCVHALSIPNGFHTHMRTCADTSRGIIPRMNEQQIPFVHFLNIKELALQYGMDVAPGSHYAPSVALYSVSNPKRTVTLLLLLCSLVAVAFLRRL